ncbi:MAG: NUDIX hydrolase [Spirochaetales bacterium]|nr:NUDIX hydrolase [Spirochaetales bacterium]
MEKKIIASGKFLKILSVDGWEYAERFHCTGIVIIVPVLDDGRIVLVEQFRKPVQAKVIELPAGLAGDYEEVRNEPLENAARRELLEETGYTADKLVLLAEGPPSPGMSTEIVTIFGAYGLKKVSEGGGDESEDIQVHLVPLEEMDDFCEKKRREGKLIDPKIFSGLYFILKK